MKYSLLPSECNDRVVFSFKATDQLLQAIKSGDCTIQFDDENSAQITAGQDRLNVVHSKCNVTETYVTGDSPSVLRFNGACAGRLKVTGNAATKKSKPSPGGKRSVAVVNADTAVSESSLHPRAVKSRRSASPKVVKRKTQQPEAPRKDQPNLPCLIMSRIPVDVTVKDILSFFSGLSVQRIVIGLQDKHSFESSGRCNVYVEFQNLNGMELAILRSGESIKFKSYHVVESSSSSASRGPKHLTSEEVLLSVLSEEELLWVKGVGFHLYDAASDSVFPSSARVSQLISDFDQCMASNTIATLNPRVLVRQWRPLLTVAHSCLFQSGRPEAKKAARQAKSPKNNEDCLMNGEYLMYNTEVDNIVDDLLFEGNDDVDKQIPNELKNRLSVWQQQLLADNSHDTGPDNEGSETRANLVKDLEAVLSTLKELSAVAQDIRIRSFSALVGDANTDHNDRMLLYCTEHVCRARAVFRLVAVLLWRNISIDS